jgi:hypothetical protein
VKLLRACWHIIGGHVHRLFQACLPFSVAEVVMLPKPNKRDLTSARAWRAISLLSSLGKGLEWLVARRLAWGEANGIAFDSDKTEAMHFSRRPASATLTIRTRRSRKAIRDGTTVARDLAVVPRDLARPYSVIQDTRLEMGGQGPGGGVPPERPHEHEARTSPRGCAAGHPGMRCPRLAPRSGGVVLSDARALIRAILYVLEGVIDYHGKFSFFFFFFFLL